MNPLHRLLPWLRRRPPETSRRRVLYFLHTHHDQSWHPNHMAQILNLDEGTVAVIVADLEEQGWVIPIYPDRVALTGHGFFAAHNELYGTTQ